MRKLLRFTFGFCFVFLPLTSCKETKPKTPEDKRVETPKLFTLLNPEETNIHFSNVLEEGLNANVLMYEYLYNGGGVATGDFNDDGLIDLYFTSNMGENKFYLNNGDMKFKDATAISKVSGRSGPWKTGITSADVNGDGKLDLYLCYSGALPPQKRQNQLFINQGNNEAGIPIFEEKAAEYGLNSPAFSNQGFFFDYDHDGDLDALLLNHNPKSLPVLNETSTAESLKKDDALQGVRLYQQNKGVFKDVTQSSGISGSALTYGLGVGISDIDNDGWEDIYISNDYTIPDYLYINNKNGTFTDELKQRIGHTSHFSMGNNIADINNDGLTDIFTLDMLPEDNRRQKLLLAPDNYEKFDLNLRSGFHYQYMRNMLQLNNGNGTFSEIGQFAGISNTDWSWAPLFADYDNDGDKDLFVTNGYFRDYTNLDFINYMENYVQSKGRLRRNDVLEIIKEMPSSNLTNYLYTNTHGIQFSDSTDEFGLNQPANSNGAAYADLDNDGDLDLVVNNINKPAFIYRNESQRKGNNFIQVALHGESTNTQGIGTRVSIFYKGKRQVLEQSPAQGYLSTVSPILHFGLGEHEKIDSLSVRWTSGKRQTLFGVKANQLLTLNENDAVNNPIKSANVKSIFSKVPSPIHHTNGKSSFNDFKRQSLLISQLSHSGPCLAKGDFNKDGREDIIIGGSKDQAATVYFQKRSGPFAKHIVPDFESDKGSHDTAIQIFDANGDGNLDIYVASGGYHDYLEKDPRLQDRLYLGNGEGGFSRSNGLPQMFTSTGCVAVQDINEDGHFDIFVGGRVIPGRYPETPRSYVLINDGKGNFTDQTTSVAPGMSNVGMTTDAIWYDMNGDTTNDLIVVGEWMPISIFILNEGKLENKTSSFFDKPFNGWWNTIAIHDFNRDGKPDIIAGNMGSNTQFTASQGQPAELFFKDFDKNGSIDPLFNFYIGDSSYPYLTRDELLGQLGNKRSKYTSYTSYADATIQDIFTANEMEGVKKLVANQMETTLFLSTDLEKYDPAKLPLEVQYSPIHDIQISDFNSDGKQDLLLLGNNDYFKLRLGKSDANYGMLLLGDDAGNFEYCNQDTSGLNIVGDVRSSLVIDDFLWLGIYGKPIETYRNLQFGQRVNENVEKNSK